MAHRISSEGENRAGERQRRRKGDPISSIPPGFTLPPGCRPPPRTGRRRQALGPNALLPGRHGCRKDAGPRPSRPRGTPPGGSACSHGAPPRLAADRPAAHRHGRSRQPFWRRRSPGGEGGVRRGVDCLKASFEAVARGLMLEDLGHFFDDEAGSLHGG